MQIPLASVIHLLHEAPHAILSTHSTQLPGYPYGTAVPLVVDAAQQPWLLISALAEHTRNLLADPRASLAVVAPGAANVQDAARTTLLGRIEAAQPSPAFLQRYLRYQPDAGQYLALDFQFFRMRIERVRFIGGVGRMGWLDAEAWRAASVLAEDDELRLLAQAPATTTLRLLGLDPFGIDYAAGDIRRRKRFETPLSATEIAGLLGDLLPDAS
ncbi:MAG TPA: pyridoxamine 5'-phosphate oxidase family protein [Azonexus sp.]